VYSGSLSDPLKAFGVMLTAFKGSGYFADLETDLKRLLSGQPVRSEDGDLEVSAMAALRPPGAHKLFVRRPGAKYVAELVLRPLSPAQNPRTRDQRDPQPCPDQWCIKNNGVRVWELFNCMVLGLEPHDEEEGQSQGDAPTPR
jgi:hypothetical protein